LARPQPIAGIDPEKPLLANAALIIPVRIAEMVAWERYIDDPDNILELHEMRIAAKRLRYTLEIFAPAIGEGMPAIINVMKMLQDHLGVIHDADVLVPELELHLRSLLQPRGKHRKAPVGVHSVDLEGAAGIITLCRNKRSERDVRYEKFIAAWQQLREEGFFDSVNDLVRQRAAQEVEEAAEAAQISTVQDNPPTDKPVNPISPGPNGDRNGKTRARRAVRTATTDRRDDTRNGPDTRPGAEEGGVGQHSLFEEGDGS
jgi:hypothetical protein